MIFNERAVPPAFIVDAIPGAPDLRDAVVAARAAFREAGVALRAAGQQMREKAVGPLGEMTPREGVTLADMDKAIDAYRHADEANRSADRAHSAALRRLHAKVRAGMETDAFKASHERLADEAQSHAVAAAAALWNALEDRNAFDAAIGRRRDPSAAAPYDLRYYRERIESILNAPVLTDHQRLVDRLDSSTMTAEERNAFAKQNGMIAG